MTFTAATETHRLALLRLVAMLFEASGMVAGKPAMLSRIIRGAVLYSLRPMEAAALRLIVALADRLKREGYVAPERAAPTKPIRSKGGSRGFAFALFDRRRRVGATGQKYAKNEPRMSFFDGSDPVVQSTPQETPVSNDEPLDATRLCNRLEALRRALKDLPKQARRLIRMQARREKAGRGFVRPIRPGRPPGYRSRGKYEVDEVLRECHQLALMALASPDTS